MRADRRRVMQRDNTMTLANKRLVSRSCPLKSGSAKRDSLSFPWLWSVKLEPVCSG